MCSLFLSALIITEKEGGMGLEKLCVPIFSIDQSCYTFIRNGHIAA